MLLSYCQYTFCNEFEALNVNYSFVIRLLFALHFPIKVSINLFFSKFVFLSIFYTTSFKSLNVRGEIHQGGNLTKKHLSIVNASIENNGEQQSLVNLSARFENRPCFHAANFLNFFPEASS